LAQAQVPPPSPGTPSDTSAQAANRSRNFHASKDLVGADVKDAQGQKLGDISEIYFNPRHGESFAAIDIGTRRHALVPLAALQVTAPAGAIRNAVVTLNKTKSDLESGPIVSNNAWQQMDDAAFTQRIYSHYNVQAPSAVGGTGSPAAVTTGEATNAPSTRPLTPRPVQPPR
jgi:hypothetical protein